jgi:hypothetical protein
MIAVVAMPRTGHTAIRSWLSKFTGEKVRNVEGHPFDHSLRRSGNNTPVLVLRDYLSWAASMLSFYPDYTERHMAESINRWVDHVAHAGQIPTIYFDRWVRAGHGRGVVGSESRFEGGSVLDRSREMTEHPCWPYVMSRTDALNMSWRAREESAA